MTLTPLMVKIACRALAEHPYLNASLDMEREQITQHAHCHIGIATSTPDGLLVPVVHHADGLSLAEIAHSVAGLTVAARERRLAPDAQQGATFTVNNFGALGVWLGTPLIVPPQVANLGVGRVSERAVVRDGAIVAAPIAPLSVSGDHRVLDGDTLAAFVTRVVELMEQPALLLEDLR
jgi:pyruvate dehydrogenase E2 component (dihydrolipoamide acetyltransferase)